MTSSEKPERTIQDETVQTGGSSPKGFRDKMRDSRIWKGMVWAAGAADVTAMALQFKRIWETQNTSNISIAMFEIFLAIQLIFAFEGWCRRSTAQFVSLLIQGGATTAVIAEILYIRSQLGDIP